MFRRCHYTARAITRIGLTLCVVAGLAAGTVGFTVTPPGLSGGAFPCQGHGCGCQSANDCWFGCCCMSPKQRLAWAKANHIEPPAGLRELVRDKVVAKAGPVAACCAKGDPAKCVPPVKSATAGCCSKDVSASCCGASKSTKVATSKPSPHSKDRSPCYEPSRCHGLGQWWVTSGQPLGLPERPVTLASLPIAQPVIIGERAYSLDGQAPPTRPG